MRGDQLFDAQHLHPVRFLRRLRGGASQRRQWAAHLFPGTGRRQCLRSELRRHPDHGPGDDCFAADEIRAHQHASTGVRADEHAVGQQQPIRHRSWFARSDLPDHQLRGATDRVTLRAQAGNSRGAIADQPDRVQHGRAGLCHKPGKFRRRGAACVGRLCDTFCGNGER